MAEAFLCAALVQYRSPPFLPHEPGLRWNARALIFIAWSDPVGSYSVGRASRYRSPFLGFWLEASRIAQSHLAA